jgi:HK97 gp10 family phage protein
VAFKVRVKIEGLRPLLAKLDGLKRTVQKSAIRKAVDAAGKVVLDAAKAAVPTNTELLKKSLGKKVIVGRKSGVAVAIVGPRTGFKVTRVDPRTAKTQTAYSGGTMDRIDRNGKFRKGRPPKKIILRIGSRSPVASNPTQYAHLVEGGRRGVTAKGRALLLSGIGFRKSAGPVTGTKFLENSLNRSKAAIVAAMAKAIDEALVKVKGK